MSYACRLAASLAAVFSILIVAGCGGTAGGDSSGPISAYPSPGSSFASPGTQISLVGLDPENPGDIKVTGSSSGEHSGKFESYSAVTGASFVPDTDINRFFDATVHATEEAILNSMVANEDMTGRDGNFVPALPRTWLARPFPKT